MWVWLVLVAADASCERTAASEEVGGKLDAALASLEDGDLARFEEDLALVELGVECLAAPVAPEMAARLHRFWGIRAFAHGDTALARGHFVTSRALEPETPLPVYPAAHPIQSAYTASLEPVPLRVQGPRGAELFVDGTAAEQLDQAGAHLLQYRVPNAEILGYHALEPGTRPPWMGAPRERRSPLKPALLAIGGASLAAAAAFGVANVVAAQGFQNAEPTTEGDLRKRQRTTNTFAVVTGVTGGVGLGFVVGGILAPGGRR